MFGNRESKTEDSHILKWCPHCGRYVLAFKWTGFEEWHCMECGRIVDSAEPLGYRGSSGTDIQEAMRRTKKESESLNETGRGAGGLGPTGR